MFSVPYVNLNHNKKYILNCICSYHMILYRLTSTLPPLPSAHVHT